MAIKRNKVVIVGAGLVGSATAFSLITQGLCDDVVLVDINQDKANAEALDLQNCIEYLGRNAKVFAGTYEQCADADIVVLTAAAPYIKGQTRLDMLDGSSKITKAVVESVMSSGFSGHFIIVTNPVDVLSYYVYKLSGLPKNQIIGTGTALDSARLKNIIGDLIHVDPRSINAFSMGEHGDSQMIPWSSIFIGGKSFRQIKEDNPDRAGHAEDDELLRQTANLGWVIADSKGTTNYGIATTTAGIIKAILFDENRIIPVSTLLDGEYGQKEVFAGVPAVLNRTGVKEIIDIPLAAQEQSQFQASVDIIREYIGKLSL